MAFFQHIPGTVKLLFVFFLILGLIKKKLPLWIAFYTGALVLGTVFNMPAGETIRHIASSAIHPSSITLSVLVLLILIFSSAMEDAGQMKRMLSNFKGLIRRQAINLVIFPAMIGLLPMPGGAVFSAPMVKELGRGAGLSETRLSMINFWFRHIWEYWWPLYPGVLLAVTLADLDLFTFIGYMAPLSGVALTIGAFRLLPARLERSATTDTVSIAPFIKEVIPILMVIAGGPALGVSMSVVLPEFTIAREAGLIAALFAATITVLIINRTPPRHIKPLLLKRTNLQMVLMIMSVLAFKAVLEASHGVRTISSELTAMNVPVVLIAIALPFSVGIITGVTVAFVGISLPVVIPLVISTGNEAMLYPYLMLSITGGFTGVLVSPLHLCFVLSNNYFGIKMNSAYRTLIPLCCVLLVAGILYFYVSTWIGLP